ncbi:MAG: hypothetical protein JWM34_3797 [Ilumatobacteraceae bacterium]|nr:hypothetical protein [Ilumatobacteraceae bacterium]
MRRLIAVLALCTASLSYAAVSSSSSAADAPPANFTDVALAPGTPFDHPTAIVPLNGQGGALILEKGGTIRSGITSPPMSLGLSVCTAGDQGLLGGAATATGGRNMDYTLFVYYTRDAGTCTSPTGHYNRLSAFDVECNHYPSTGCNFGLERVLLDHIPTGNGTNQGGGVALGTDGDVYVSVGDGGANPRGGPGSAAQDLSQLNGKLLRVTRNGATPPDNPYVADPAAIACATAGLSVPTTAKCTEIYASGLRDPGRPEVSPNSINGPVYINDADPLYQEVNQVAAGANYGWDTREGVCAPGSASSCPPKPAALTDPLYAYQALNGCTSITNGAFVPDGAWPNQFIANYLVADRGCGSLWTRDPAGNVDLANPLIQNPAGIIDIAFVRPKDLGTAIPTSLPQLLYIAGDNTVHELDFNLTAPTIDPLAEQIVAAPPGAGEVTIALPLPTAHDSRGAITPTCNPTAPSSSPPPQSTLPLGSTTIYCEVQNSAGYATSSYTLTVIAGKEFLPLPPARLADTRAGATTVDGASAGGGAVTAGSTFQLQVAERGGVVGDAAAVSLNVTAIAGTRSGFATVFPCGSPQPTASNVNYTAGGIVPDAVVTKLGTGGKVCIYVSAPTDLVVDVNGYFPTNTTLTSINPIRLLDTRAGMVSFDGIPGDGLKAPGTVRTVKVTGRGAGLFTSVAVLTVTVTEAEGAGFVTVYPCGTDRPTTSTLNYGPFDTRANLAITKLGTDGSVCIYSQQATHLIVDLDAYFEAPTTYSPVGPARLLDTRAGETTTDGQDLGAGTRPAGAVTTLQITGRAGVPAGATTAVLNITATNPAAAGYVTAYPCGIDPPVASNLNFTTRQTVANAAIVKLSATGTICLYNSQPTDLITDITGIFPM